MADRIEPWDLVGSGQTVQAHYLSGDHIHGEGVVIAYQDAPSVIIRRPDGSTFSWRADLIRVADTKGGE